MNLKVKITVVISFVFLLIISLLGYVFFITMNASLQDDLEAEAQQICNEAAFAINKNVYSDIYVIRAVMVRSEISSGDTLDKKIKTVQEIVQLFQYEYMLLMWGDDCYKVYHEWYVDYPPDRNTPFSSVQETIQYGNLYIGETPGLLISEPAMTSYDGTQYQMVLKRKADWMWADFISSDTLKGKNVVISTSTGEVLFPTQFHKMDSKEPGKLPPEATMSWITLDGPDSKKDIYAYTMTLNNIPLRITSYVDQSDIIGKLKEYEINYVLLAAGSLVVIAVIVYYLSMHMTGAVTNLARYVENIDHTGNVPEQFTRRKDETGVLARAFTLLIQRLRTTIEEKEYIAFHDKLTGLPNRYVLEKDVDELFAEGSTFAFALMDIDNFKTVNDELGHMEGDRLLFLIADILRSFDQQKLKAYRWGGDEFGIVLYGDNKEDYQRTLDEIMNKAKAGLSSFPVKVGMSIGACICPERGNTQKTMLKCADNALCEVKRRGKNHYLFCESAN